MQTKPFLIIQLRAQDAAAQGELQAFLDVGKLKECEIIKIRGEKKGLPDINLENYSAIIVGGSPFDITTPLDEQSDIQKQLAKDFTKLFDKVIAQDFPFIGICSGNGLLGNYCGVKITKEVGEPVSGIDLTLTEEGKKDPILKELPNTFRALVGHKEGCSITPPNATLLATGKNCPVQMFKLGNNVYATQFHPELNAERMIERLKLYKNSGYFKPEEMQKVIDNIANETITEPGKILKRFVARYRK